MGVIYWAVCDDCGVRRDLDKFQTLTGRVETRDEAFEYIEGVAEYDHFRAALLLSFMGKHMDHRCRVVNDATCGDDVFDIPEDYDFWRQESKP